MWATLLQKHTFSRHSFSETSALVGTGSPTVRVISPHALTVEAILLQEHKSLPLCQFLKSWEASWKTLQESTCRNNSAKQPAVFLFFPWFLKELILTLQLFSIWEQHSLLLTPWSPQANDHKLRKQKAQAKSLQGTGNIGWLDFGLGGA